MYFRCQLLWLAMDPQPDVRVEQQPHRLFFTGLRIRRPFLRGFPIGFVADRADDVTVDPEIIAQDANPALGALSDRGRHDFCYRLSKASHTDGLVRPAHALKHRQAGSFKLRNGYLFQEATPSKHEVSKYLNHGQ
jgi:hypothetical protein